MTLTTVNPPRGVICPIITPLTTAESLDEPVLRRLLNELAPTVDGLMLLGTTGELPILAPEVADHLTDVTLDAVGDSGLQIVLGVGGTGWAQTRRNLERVRDRIDAVAVCTPYYYPFTQHDLQEHVERVIDYCTRPVILYNIPQNTNQEFCLDVVARLAEHDRVVGIKDSGPSEDYFRQLLELRSASFTVLRGADLSFARSYQDAGADGFVNGLENIVPGITKAALDADTEVLARCTLRELEKLTANPLGLARIKAGVAARHGGSGTIAGGAASLTSAEAEKTYRMLSALTLDKHLPPT